MPVNNTLRFSNRVEDYTKYRPAYPAAILAYLQAEFNLTNENIIADIGSGTGISSELFLNAGYRVLAIEPNKEMRDKAVELLRKYPHHSSVCATAEATSLAGNSVDAIISGQAFHWFDQEKARIEFKRILKPGGIIVLIWNERKTKTAFEIEYDQLILDHAIDYIKVDHRNVNDSDIENFFSPKNCSLKIFDNYQVFGYEGLEGRLLSSSYMPAKNDPGHAAMILDLKSLFSRFKENDYIKINYATKVYVGSIP